MELISPERRNELVLRARTQLKLELRDHYAVDEAAIAAWRAGDSETVRARTATWHSRTAARVASGVRMRRVKVVSEPPSEYVRYAIDVSTPAVEAGEDIRWLPRRLTSALLLPGNDFFVLDDQIVIFNVLDGDDGPAERQLWTEPDIVSQCREAFEAAWKQAVPHRDYRPA
jgi:hypothetical protein